MKIKFPITIFNKQDLLESDFVSSGSEAVVSRQLSVDGFYK
jgi:hypothetical protein